LLKSSSSGATDQPSAALIQDLKERGMLDDTLVIWGGEFGRTVYSQGALTATVDGPVRAPIGVAHDDLYQLAHLATPGPHALDLAVRTGTSLYSFGDPLTVLAAQMTPKALKPDGDLAYFNWAQYINPKLLRGFEKAYKVKVHESNFTNMDNMLAKFRAGVKFDVAFPEAQTAAQLVKANLLAPLDHSNITNWSQVNSAFHNPWYDAGAKYTVPYAIWTTGIAWRTDKVKGMTGSWNDLWNHPEAAKHTYLLDDMRERINRPLGAP